MNYTEEQKKRAWENAQIAENTDPQRYRKDCCGAWIAWDKYGCQDSPFGWEIDHIYPRSKGGTTIPQNIRAMQHQNNSSKGASYPYYLAVVTSDGDHNVSISKTLMINKDRQQILKQLYNI